MDGKFHRLISVVPQYGKTFYASFYSSFLYADIVKRWNGLGIRYLLLLIILGVIPLSWRIVSEFNHFFEEEVLFPIQALPLLSIHHGEITYSQPMPYLIKNHEGEVVSIIDTTGAVSEMNPLYPKLTVLITKNKIDFRPPSYKQFLGLSNNANDNPIYTRTFEQELNGQLSGEEWIHATGISKLNTLVQLAVFPCVTIFYFCFFSILLLILSALVQLYSDIFFNHKIPFKASCRLLSVAATPTLTLFFLMRSINFAVPRIGLDYIVLLLTYISYGLYSAKRLNV